MLLCCGMIYLVLNVFDLSLFFQNRMQFCTACVGLNAGGATVSKKGKTED